MTNKLKALLIGFLLISSSVFCDNLHVFYEQNGDCFVLIGSGTYRGVYALNNLTTDNYSYMYDPKLSYGLSAGQWWSGDSNETSPSFIQKRLYTFYATNESSRSLTGVNVKRRVIPRGDSGRYGEDPPFIVHRAHSSPTSSPTGLGNHTHTDYMRSLDTFFTPSDIPCTKRPVSAGKDKEGNQLYWVTAGIDWYHDRTENVYSNWTYSGSGGWCHRVSKDFLTEYTHDINLEAMNINNKRSPVRDNALCSFVDTVTTETKGYKQTYGECVDGCIRAQPNVTLPGIPEPIVRFVYSSQLKKSYLYNRPYGETTYTLNKNPSDIVVGKGDNLTCNFIGISTKNNVSNYVYLLGSEVINKWMQDANCPSSMYISRPEDLACVAVSDQWWQSGGIVYAYDSAKSKVYSFVRVENGKSGPPDEIDVHFDGVKPDKICADGFGNLYVLKTELDPPDTKKFGQDGTETFRKDINFSYNGQKHFVAVYRQMIYKTVYKRPYGLDTSFSKINRRIPIGVNEFEKEYVTADNKIDSTKIWWSSLQQTKNEGDGRNIPTELAVINVPTPPKPQNVDAIADCCGPMDLTPTGFAKASPDNDDGSYSSTRNIFFIAENAPYCDANGINVTGATEDKDDDGTIGCYPNTIKESSVVYHWRIVKTKDQFGNTINPGDKDYKVLDTTGDYLLVFPSLLEGEFDVGLKVEYRYYDYTKLKVGALASQKETCLYPTPSDPRKIAAAGGRIVRDGYSWEHIKQTWKRPPAPPEGNGIIMSSLDYDDESGYKPAISDNDKNLKKTIFVMDGASLCRQVDKDKNTSYKTNIRWGLKLRETQANLDKGINRINILMNDTPPDPNDSNMIPDTLKWVEDFKVSWRADLYRENDSIWSKTLTLENFNLTQDQLRELMPFPSDPLRYVITAEVSRQYEYKVYVRYPVRQTSYGWEYKTERVPVIVTVSINGEAEVCVTDNTGPSLWQYNAEENASERIVPGYKMVYADSAKKKITSENVTFIKASTGEKLSDSESKVKYVVFYVCDNNPMGNYDGPRVVNTNTKNLYFLTDTNILRCSFNKDARYGVLHYDTANGVMPTANLRSSYIYRPIPVTSEAELLSVGLVPSKALSYVKYEIPVNNFKHYSNMDRIDKARLPFNYANNTNGYSNYRFGLSWSESCNASYNALENENAVIGPSKPNYFVGNVVIKDNDRPNIFISGFQDRFPTMGDKFMVPTVVVKKDWFNPDNNGNFSSIKPSSEWFLTVDDWNNGPKDWFRGNAFGGDIKDYFTFQNPREAETLIFRKISTGNNQTEDCRLLIDVPASFRYVMIDNSGTASCKSFKLYAYDGNRKLMDADSEGTIQYVFRKAGKYYLELKAEDDAKDWPAYTNVNNPTQAGNAKNERTLRAYFEVLDSKFDYRVIERSINEK